MFGVNDSRRPPRARFLYVVRPRVASLAVYAMSLSLTIFTKHRSGGEVYNASPVDNEWTGSGWRGLQCERDLPLALDITDARRDCTAVSCLFLDRQGGCGSAGFESEGERVRR